MSYTLTLPLQSSGKMEVTPQQSEILQKELFKMGYVALPSRLYIKGKPFVFWYDGKQISAISNNDSEYFEQHENELHLFDNHFKIEELCKH